MKETQRIGYYANYRVSPNELKSGEIKEGDLICNTITGFAWRATAFDANSIKPDTYKEHTKFRKMLPLI